MKLFATILLGWPGRGCVQNQNVALPHWLHFEATNLSCMFRSWSDWVKVGFNYLNFVILKNQSSSTTILIITICFPVFQEWYATFWYIVCAFPFQFFDMSDLWHCHSLRLYYMTVVGQTVVKVLKLGVQLWVSSSRC